MILKSLLGKQDISNDVVGESRRTFVGFQNNNSFDILGNKQIEFIANHKYFCFIKLSEVFPTQITQLYFQLIGSTTYYDNIGLNNVGTSYFGIAAPTITINGTITRNRFAFLYEDVSEIPTVSPQYAIIIDLTELGLDNLTAEQFYSKYHRAFRKLASGKEVSGNSIGLAKSVSVGHLKAKSLLGKHKDFVEAGSSTSGTLFAYDKSANNTIRYAVRDYCANTNNFDMVDNNRYAIVLKATNSFPTLNNILIKGKGGGVNLLKYSQYINDKFIVLITYTDLDSQYFTGIVLTTNETHNLVDMKADYMVAINLTELGLDTLTAEQFYNLYNDKFDDLANGRDVALDGKLAKRILDQKDAKLLFKRVGQNYTEAEYVSGSIDTLFVPNANTRFETSFCFTRDSITTGDYVGLYVNSSGVYMVAQPYDVNKLCLSKGQMSSLAYTNMVKYKYYNIILDCSNTGKSYVDGVEVNVPNGYGFPSDTFKITRGVNVKYLKIYDNNILVRHFVPVIGGLYDLVDGGFYPATNSECLVNSHEVVVSEVGQIMSSKIGTNRFNTVDLGAFTWYYSDGIFYTIDLPINKNVNGLAFCSKYTQFVGERTSMTDKTFTLKGGSEKTVWFKDSSYTDATTFKNAIKGTLFHYETTEAKPLASFMRLEEIGGVSYVENNTIKTSEPIKLKWCGKNLFNLSERHGGYYISNKFNKSDDSVFWQYVVVRVEPNKTYTFSGFGNTGGAYTAYLNSSDPSDFNSNAWLCANNDGTHTIPNGIHYLGVCFNFGGVYEDKYPMIELSSTQTDYEPYRQKTILIGATKYNEVDLGSLTWNYVSGSTRLYSTGLTRLIKGLPYSTTIKPNIYCSKYVTSTNAVIYDQTGDKVISLDQDGNVFIRDTAYTDANALKQALQGVILKYETVDSNPKLYGINDVRDTYNVPSGIVTRRFGIVDLGTLSWNKANYGWYNTKNDIKSVSALTQLANIECNSLVVKTSQQINFGAQDGIAVDQNKHIQIRDSRLVDKTSQEVKALLSGVMLVYELETPTTEQHEICKQYYPQGRIEIDDVVEINGGYE